MNAALFYYPDNIILSFFFFRNGGFVSFIESTVKSEPHMCVCVLQVKDELWSGRLVEVLNSASNHRDGFGAGASCGG
jgi:hypothetical protein